jgi:hypothetical protein
MNDTEDARQTDQPQGDRQGPTHGGEPPAKPVGAENSDPAQNQNTQRPGGPIERFLKSANFWKSHGFWLAVGTWVLVVVTGVIGKCALDDTERVLTASQRAWVGPLTSLIDDWPTVGGRGIKGAVIFANFGKEPALDVTISEISRTFPRGPWENGLAAQTIAQIAKACYEFPVIPGVYTIFASIGSTYRRAWDSSKFESTILSSDALIKGDQIFALIGCTAYRTLGGIRHTTFCFQHDAKAELPMNPMSYCGVGNTAD